MSFTAYIVASDLLDASPPRGGEWHATASAADPSQSLVVIEWDNSNGAGDFEGQPGVVILGLPWEPMSADALSLLALFQDGVAAKTGATVNIPVDGTTAPPPAVSTALRQIAWPGARLSR